MPISGPVAFPTVCAYYTTAKLGVCKSANFHKEITPKLSLFLSFWVWAHAGAIADCFYDSNDCTELLKLSLILGTGLVGKVQIWNNCCRRKAIPARLVHCGNTPRSGRGRAFSWTSRFLRSQFAELAGSVAVPQPLQLSRSPDLSGPGRLQLCWMEETPKTTVPPSPSPLTALDLKCIFWGKKKKDLNIWSSSLAEKTLCSYSLMLPYLCSDPVPEVSHWLLSQTRC